MLWGEKGRHLRYMTGINSTYRSGILCFMDLVHHLMLKTIKYKTLHFGNRISAYPQAKNTIKTNLVGLNRYSYSQPLGLEVEKGLVCYIVPAESYR
jgi:hypothetical protein